MATQTLANADAILKDLYVGPIIEQMNQKTILLDALERDSDHIAFQGRRAVIPVHKGRNRGRRSISDGGTLPSAGTQQYLDADIPIRFNSYSIEVTDAAAKATKGNDGAFIALLKSESEGVGNDMRKDMNRQFFGLGNGVLAKAKKTSTSTTLEVQNEAELQYIFPGDIIDVLVESTGATTNGVVGAEVTEIKVSESKIILSKALSAELAAETYAIYIHENRNQESDGLRNITESNRTLHSINSATAGNQFWNGQSVKAGTSVSATAVAGEPLFMNLADKVGATGNGDVELYITTRGVKRRLAESYASTKRFNDNKAVEVHGGYTAVFVNEIPVVSDDDCPKQFAFGMNKSALKIVELTPPEWLEQNGQILFLKNAGTGINAAVWQGYWIWYAALGCLAANRVGRIEFAQDDAPSSNG
jgi:hypothetical protein